MRWGPMVPQIIDALYTTFEPLHVKRWVFLELHRLGILAIIHRRTNRDQLVRGKDFRCMDRPTSCLGCCGKDRRVYLSCKKHSGRYFLERFSSRTSMTIREGWGREALTMYCPNFMSLAKSTSKNNSQRQAYSKYSCNAHTAMLYGVISVAFHHHIGDGLARPSVSSNELGDDVQEAG